MSPSVTLLYPGRMGSALARRLVDSGLDDLRSCVDGRSEATRARATAAGIALGGADWAASADAILSVLPPELALDTARAQAARTAALGQAQVYIDLNAINPGTAREIDAAITAAGGLFIDGCIIGTLPRAGYEGPWVYLSGPHTDKASWLAEAGLNVTCLEAPVGGASALKMCFAGIMKGLQALGSASALAAERNGVGEAFGEILARTQPDLDAWFARQVPRMYPKTYRWVGEMREIADFLLEHEGAEMFSGAAALYAHLSDIDAQSAASLATLRARFGATEPKTPSEAASS